MLDREVDRRYLKLGEVIAEKESISLQNSICSVIETGRGYTESIVMLYTSLTDLNLVVSKIFLSMFLFLFLGDGIVEPIPINVKTGIYNLLISILSNNNLDWFAYYVL